MAFLDYEGLEHFYNGIKQEFGGGNTYFIDGTAELTEEAEFSVTLAADFNFSEMAEAYRTGKDLCLKLDMGGALLFIPLNCVAESSVFVFQAPMISNQSGLAIAIISEDETAANGFTISTGFTAIPDGSSGQDGKSAYEIAVDNGFVGTEQEWLESLGGDSDNSGHIITVMLSVEEFMGLLENGYVEYMPLPLPEGEEGLIPSPLTPEDYIQGETAFNNNSNVIFDLRFPAMIANGGIQILAGQCDGYILCGSTTLYMDLDGEGSRHWNFSASLDNTGRLYVKNTKLEFDGGNSSPVDLSGYASIYHNHDFEYYPRTEAHGVFAPIQHIHSYGQIDGLDRKIEEITEIANGKCACYVFDVISRTANDPPEATELDAWLTNPENTENLKVGDVFLIRKTDVPDYWWDGTDKQPLETTKVDLTQYYTKAEVDEKIPYTFDVSNSPPPANMPNNVITFVV